MTTHRPLPTPVLAALSLLLGACPSSPRPRDAGKQPDAAELDAAAPDAPPAADRGDASPGELPPAADARDGGDAQVFPRRPSCTAVRTALQNGSFEAPLQGGAIPGWQVETTGGASVVWEPVSGYSGTGGLGVRIPDTGQASEAVVRQSLELDPHTTYVLRARVAADNFRPRGDTPFLFLVTARTPGGRTWTVGPRKRDSTDLDYASQTLELATGPDGKVDIELRSSAAGRFLVDEVTLECNERAQRFEGQTLVLNLYDDQVASATPPLIEQVLATLDRVLVAYADLTGGDDPRMRKQSAWGSRSATNTELRGSPAVWSGSVSAMTWALSEYVPTPLALALARNFDRPQWLFDDEFAELYLYYALETLDLRVGARDELDRGRNYRLRLEARHKDAWATGRCAEPGGLVWKNILIRDQVGWEPFKKAFRHFKDLPATSVPASRFERLRLWHQKLGELAGMPVWDTMFTAEEKALLQARYGATPAPRRLAELPAAMTTASLSAIAWESAVVAIAPLARNTQPNGCPLRSAAGVHPSGLFVYPFSQHVYRLGRGWKRLAGGFALHAPSGVAAMGSVVFVVRGDGRELFRSPLVVDATPAMFSVDVTSVDRLELIVTDGADRLLSDAALWIDPTLTR